MSSKRSRPPRVATPAAATRELLIDAVLRLLTTRSVAAVSVRDVAAEAGVNHGLVHRYFGSKEALIREAVKRASSLVYVEGAPPRASWFLERLRAHPEIAILVARASLDGPRDLLAMAAPPPALLEQLVARLAPALKPTGADPHLVNALWTSALLGWIVFRPVLDAGYRLPPDADDRLTALIAALDRMLDG